MKTRKAQKNNYRENSAVHMIKHENGQFSINFKLCPVFRLGGKTSNLTPFQDCSSIIYILSIMQYDSICLEDKCRIDHKQLFSSRKDNNHFDQKHAVQLIHYGSPFFRSLKTGPIKFSVSLEKTCSQLQKLYQRSLELIKQILKSNFQQCERKIRDIYQLDHKEVNLELLEPHLKKTTPKTEQCLALINWKKAHPSEDIQKYIQNIPKTCINDYTTRMNSLVQVLLNRPASFSKLPQKGSQSKDKEISLKLDQSSILLQKVLGKRIDKGHGRNLNFEPKAVRQESQQQHQQQQAQQNISHINDSPILHKQELKNKPQNNKRDDALMQLAEVFCNLESNIKYQDIKGSLLNKLPKQRRYRSSIDSVMCRVCSGIERYIMKEFGFRIMSTRDRVRSYTDIKNYMSWMDKEEADIFIRCVRFFMNINKDIEISPYQIYVMHVLITTKVIEKMSKTDTKLSYNDSPLDLKKEIIYLYMHYDNFNKVKEILIARYPYQKKLTDGRLKQTFKEIMIHTYNRLKERESIENERFQKLINQETAFSGELWSQVVRKFIEYRIHGKVDKSEKKGLQKIMKFIVSKQQSKSRGKEEIQAEEDVRAIEQAFDKFKEKPLVIDLEEEINIPSNGFNMKNKEEKNSQIHQFQEIVKDEQIQDQGSFSQYELDIEQKGN